MDCKAAIKHKPDYPKAHHRMALAYHKLGKLGDCVAVCDTILNRNSEDTKAKELRKKALADKVRRCISTLNAL